MGLFRGCGPRWEWCLGVLGVVSAGEEGPGGLGWRGGEGPQEGRGEAGGGAAGPGRVGGWCAGGRPTVPVVWMLLTPWLIPEATAAGQGVPGSIPGPARPTGAASHCRTVLWGPWRAGWERPHAQLIRPVAFLGDVFCVEKSWETSLCGAECTSRHTPGTGLGPALHLGAPWAHWGPTEARPGSLQAAGGVSKGLWGGPGRQAGATEDGGPSRGARPGDLPCPKAERGASLTSDLCSSLFLKSWGLGCAPSDPCRAGGSGPGLDRLPPLSPRLGAPCPGRPPSVHPRALFPWSQCLGRGRRRIHA